MDTEARRCLWAMQVRPWSRRSSREKQLICFWPVTGWETVPCGQPLSSYRRSLLKSIPRKQSGKGEWQMRTFLQKTVVVFIRQCGAKKEGTKLMTWSPLHHNQKDNDFNLFGSGRDYIPNGGHKNPLPLLKSQCVFALVTLPELAITEYTYFFYFQKMKCKLFLMFLVYQAHVRLMFSSTVSFFIIFSINTVWCVPCISYAIYTHLFYALQLLEDNKNFIFPLKKILPLV